MISSTRAMNSGLRKSRSPFIARSLLISPSVFVNPTLFVPVELPALEVMQMIVFSKLTERPCASFILPSSSIWSSIFITSG